jgi:hypothetical protein
VTYYVSDGRMERPIMSARSIRTACLALSFNLAIFSPKCDPLLVLDSSIQGVRFSKFGQE